MAHTTRRTCGAWQEVYTITHQPRGSAEGCTRRNVPGIRISSAPMANTDVRAIRPALFFFELVKHFENFIIKHRVQIC